MPLLIDGPAEAEQRTNQSAESVGDMPTLEEREQRYRRARLRLLAAQEEKTWATAEFFDARAALHCTLEAIWPGPSEG